MHLRKMKLFQICRVAIGSGTIFTGSLCREVNLTIISRAGVTIFVYNFHSHIR